MSSPDYRERLKGLFLRELDSGRFATEWKRHDGELRDERPPYELVVTAYRDRPRPTSSDRVDSNPWRDVVGTPAFLQSIGRDEIDRFLEFEAGLNRRWRSLDVRLRGR